MIFVSSSMHKYKEFCEIIKSCIKTPNICIKVLNIIEIQGDEDEIIREKAKTAYEIINKEFDCKNSPIIVEDLSFQIEYLNNFPGPYIKYFLEKLGCDGIYNLIKSYENKSAKATCKYAYYDGKKVNIFTGVVYGKIVKPRGENGFGFDKIFQPNGYSKTYAEMDIVDKNKISERFLAISNLVKFLKNINDDEKK